MDDVTRDLINHYLQKGNSILRSSGARGAADALEPYKNALTLWSSLQTPTEDDFDVRRKINCVLGYCTYHSRQDNTDITALKQAYEYFAQSTPFTSEFNEYWISAYVLTMSDLYDFSAAVYGKQCRDALEEIYKSYFYNFDVDHKSFLLYCLIRFRCDALCGTPDYYGAEQLNRNLLELAQQKSSIGSNDDDDVTEADIYNMHSELKQLIEAKRGTIPSTTNDSSTPSSNTTSYSSTSSSTGYSSSASSGSGKFWYEKVFPLSCTLISVGELFGRILIYIGATILAFIIASGLGVLVGLYSIIGIVIAILDYNCCI